MFRFSGLILGALFFIGGLLACGASAYYMFQDWNSLNHFYARFEELIRENGSQRSLFIVATHQAAFRLNCFADGVGVLMGAILAALGWAQIERARGSKT